MPEALARLIVKTKGDASTVYFCMSETDVMYFLRQEITIGSDGSGWSITGEENKERPHPRFFGTYPRFLRLVREQRLCTMEDAVRRITALPASYVELADRGLLKEGVVTDITVFDEKTIYDTPTYDKPFQKCAGIIHVLLEGQFAPRDGEETDLRLGHFLKKRQTPKEKRSPVIYFISQGTFRVSRNPAVHQAQAGFLSQMRPNMRNSKVYLSSCHFHLASFFKFMAANLSFTQFAV